MLPPTDQTPAPTQPVLPTPPPDLEAQVIPPTSGSPSMLMSLPPQPQNVQAPVVLELVLNSKPPLTPEGQNPATSQHQAQPTQPPSSKPQSRLGQSRPITWDQEPNPLELVMEQRVPDEVLMDQNWGDWENGVGPDQLLSTLEGMQQRGPDKIWVPDWWRGSPESFVSTINLMLQQTIVRRSTKNWMLGEKQRALLECLCRMLDAGLTSAPTQASLSNPVLFPE